MLRLTKIQYGATLECKWEAFMKVNYSRTNKCWLAYHILWNASKNGLITNPMQAWKCLMSLNVEKAKINYQKCFHDLFKEKEEYRKLLNNFYKHKRNMNVLKFGEI